MSISASPESINSVAACNERLEISHIIWRLVELGEGSCQRRFDDALPSGRRDRTRSRSGWKQHYFVDDDVFEQLSALEDELIDDYVRGNLAEPQRKQFELHFLNSARAATEACVRRILLSVLVSCTHSRRSRKTGDVAAEDNGLV